MHPLRTLALLALAAAAVSCARNAGYDTGNPYGTPDAGYTAANPVYDTPAAYEDASGATPPADPGAINPAIPRPAIAGPASAPHSAAGNRIHVVVPGDVLGKIAIKYNVPITSIKAANQMTSDTVVLGKKLIIPPR